MRPTIILFQIREAISPSGEKFPLRKVNAAIITAKDVPENPLNILNITLPIIFSSFYVFSVLSGDFRVVFKFPSLAILPV